MRMTISWGSIFVVTFSYEAMVDIANELAREAALIKLLDANGLCLIGN